MIFRQKIILNYISFILLQDCDFFTGEGMPKTAFPNGWKGENGMYTVGFTGKGLYGASLDALNVAQDIAQIWSKTPKEES